MIRKAVPILMGTFMVAFAIVLLFIGLQTLYATWYPDRETEQIIYECHNPRPWSDDWNNCVVAEVMGDVVGTDVYWLGLHR